LLKVDDTVRIVRLRSLQRPYSGKAGVRRSPLVGDLGTLVHQYDPADPWAPVSVEKVDPDGNTIWRADFQPDELERVDTSA
jgi:hypothetical protein